MDALTVTREEFRLEMNKLLEFLAQGLGGVPSTYSNEVIDPLALLLAGTPKLLATAEPPANYESLRLPTTQWVRKFSGALMKAGGAMTGTFTEAVRTVAAGAFDLATGNIWDVPAVAVPNPTGAVAGTSGLLILSALPVSWGSAFKFTGGSAPAPVAFPTVLPFYVNSPTEVLIGKPTEFG